MVIEINPIRTPRGAALALFLNARLENYKINARPNLEQISVYLRWKLKLQS